MSATLTLATRERGGLPLVELDHLRPWGVDAIITARNGGVSRGPYESLNLAAHVGDDPVAVAENRRRVAAAMGVAIDRLVIASQVHGDVVNDVDDWDGTALTGDALVSTRRDVALCVLVADCVPLLFVDSGTARIGVAHAGWRGLARGVVEATLSHFRDPSEVHVVIGPHISLDRYQVGPEVAAHFFDVPHACVEDVGDRWRLDLGAVAEDQLRSRGVLEGHITRCDHSSDDVQLFYSDRAARPCGRFGLVARRTSYDSKVTGGTT